MQGSAPDRLQAQRDRAAAFRHLHARRDGRVLVLPNAWDAMSARLVEAAGAPAVATTSSGVSWSLGRPDGEALTRQEAVDAVRRIVAAVRVPVTADVESGFGAGTTGDVAETVRLVLEAGAVGINLEDSAPRPTRVLLPPEAQVERLVTARVTAALRGVDLFINARIDTYLVADGRDGGDGGDGGDAARLEETVRRARIYAGAGADGAFVPGVTDAATIRCLATALAHVGLPLNVMAGPGAPSVAELRALGVTRVSVGPAITQAVMTHVRRAAAEVLRDGTYDLLRDGMPFPEADGLFAPGRAPGRASSGT